VGTKAVNALSSESVRDEKPEFSAGNLMEEEVIDTTKRKGTKVTYLDEAIFKITNR
jgi:topoisomerase-4 subunit B